MSDDYSEHERSGCEAEESEKWVEGVVELHRDWQDFQKAASDTADCSPEFLRRCEEAARIARMLTKYSIHSDSIGFAPVSFARYINRLEQSTQIPAQPLLQHFGIANPEELNDASVEGLARLWRSIGKTVREALATLRITMFCPDNLITERLRMSSGETRGILEASEASIREFEGRLNAHQLLRAHKFELRVMAEYGPAAKD